MSKRTHYRPRTEAEQAAHLDAARADPEAAMREVLSDAEPAGQAVAVLDPPESGPPDDVELGGMPDADVPGEPAEIIQQQSAPAKKPGVRFNTVDPVAVAVAGAMAAQLASAWPEGPLVIDWPWGAEPNPQVGDILGWNWARGEVAVVVKQPDIQCSEPWRITIEVRPMPEEWRNVKLFDLNTGKRHDSIEWYCRWNRAYVAATGGGGGWLAVVRDE